MTLTLSMGLKQDVQKCCSRCYPVSGPVPPPAPGQVGRRKPKCIGGGAGHESLFQKKFSMSLLTRPLSAVPVINLGCVEAGH